jgi:hypothetical protein
MGDEMTGLPTIVALAVLNGVLVATSFASLSYSIDTRARAIIAEANLQQAERKWMACHESGVYTVGEDVYMARVKKSALNVRQLPEVRGL